MKITPAIAAYVRSLADHDGRITPSAVVADAKRPESPLHALFSWDVDEAAERWWETQARAIIRKVVVLPSETTHVAIRAPYFVRDARVDPKSQGYVSVATLQSDYAYARESLVVELRRIEGNIRRARALAVVLDLEDEVERMLETFVAFRKRVEVIEATPVVDQPTA